jgi:hypothetical protein
VIERIDDMPARTIGLRASGKLTRDDYRRVLEPALREGIDTGELRLLFALPDFDGLEPAALPEDSKTGLSDEYLRSCSIWSGSGRATARGTISLPSARQANFAGEEFPRAPTDHLIRVMAVSPRAIYLRLMATSPDQAAVPPGEAAAPPPSRHRPLGWIVGACCSCSWPSVSRSGR